LDLDGFKRLNDTHGHDTGNECLQRVADELAKSVRVGDTVGRVGGDEFAILFPQVDPAALGEISQRIRLAVYALPFEVSVSIGVASWPADGTAPDVIMKKADEAMYRDKRGQKR
jgi:diguanylate cyclase (GGDEF)-like protein